MWSEGIFIKKINKHFKHGFGNFQKTELKLTNVARASLEELRLDYEDFLRQREFPLLEPNHPALQRFKARRCSTLTEVRTWVQDELGRTQTNTNQDKSMPVSARPCSSALVANAALSLLNLCCYFLDRQLATQAKTFTEEGGFTERLYKVRSQAKQNQRFK